MVVAKASQVTAVLLDSLLIYLRKVCSFVRTGSHMCLGKLIWEKTSLSYLRTLTRFDRIFSFHLSHLGSDAFSSSLQTRLDIVSSL